MQTLNHIMTMTLHTARITGPVPYRAQSGRQLHIPIGPCLVEDVDDRSVDIIWGAQGQSSAALPVEEIETAKGHGYLVLLD